MTPYAIDETNEMIRLTVFNNKPPLELKLFKFHSFSDGLIGYESLRDLGVELLLQLKKSDYSGTQCKI